MVIFQDKSMGNTVFLIDEEIYGNGPDVKDNEGYATPHWEVSVKYWVFLQAGIIVIEEDAQIKTGRDENAHQDANIEEPTRSIDLDLGQFP